MEVTKIQMIRSERVPEELQMEFLDILQEAVIKAIPKEKKCKTTEKKKKVKSCPTLCDPMDCSLAGSSVYGVLQARILEWVTIPLSRESSQPSAQI